MEKFKLISIWLCACLIGIILLFALVDWLFLTIEHRQTAYELLDSQVVKRDSNLPKTHWKTFSKCLKSARRSKDSKSQKVSVIKECLTAYQVARRSYYAERANILSQEINQAPKPSSALYFARGNAYRIQRKCWRAISDYQTACSLRDEVACHLIDLKERCSSNLLFYWGDLIAYNQKAPANEFLDPNKRSIPIIEKLLNEKEQINKQPQPPLGDGYQSFAPY